jgi:hypothetical protein
MRKIYTNSIDMGRYIWKILAEGKKPFMTVRNIDAGRQVPPRDALTMEEE